jgi:hypothetical protein
MTSVTPCPHNWSETTEPKCPGKGNANNCNNHSMFGYTYPWH